MRGCWLVQYSMSAHISLPRYYLTWRDLERGQLKRPPASMYSPTCHVSTWWPWTRHISRDVCFLFGGSVTALGGETCSVVTLRRKRGVRHRDAREWGIVQCWRRKESPEWLLSKHLLQCSCCDCCCGWLFSGDACEWAW